MEPETEIETEGESFFFPPESVEEDNALTLNIDGWEGPLDLLLALARNQKVDLREISILELVQQYLKYIADAQFLRLELAADYLVMAAWLTYLKSGLLLPKDPEIDPSPEELALRLQMRLERLNAMREAGARLMGRDRIGRDVFARGAPEGLKVLKNREWQAGYYDLISAYSRVKMRNAPAVHIVKQRMVMTLEDALARVSMMLGEAIDWMDICDFLPRGAPLQLRKSALASSFLAALELAKQGKLVMDQDESFAPLRIKAVING
ncbi:segregation and condensation protein A [Parasphingorhabdus halotolerans]|uniref:Segregation and condensation protein A n=1 Tax=Parasphingorhabdus halotolerans TaxID=2725558 RepID=A0A6H2DLP0_9SPHN|nr:ScpA family protein [Parasphingorhabdus halotolerans]QJB69047.1 segregation/condensation protein A [Parasphingorhabdus halotolerans]